MHNTSFLLFLIVCICLTLLAVTFQQTSALRRIKRGSTGTQNKTKLSNDILSDQHISGGHPITAPVSHQEANGQSEHAWAKKAVAAVEHVIDKALASLGHKSDQNQDKTKKSTHPSHSQQSHGNIATPKPEDANVVGKDLHKPSLAYLLNNGGFGERFFDDMQHGAAFGAGEGAAEVLIIDNGMQPMLGMQHGLNSFAFHQPNLRSIANSFKRLSEISQDSKLYNPKALKINTDHSNNNAAVSNNIVGKLSNDNGISSATAHKEDAVLKNNKRNDNRNNSSGSKSAVGVADSPKRKNYHITTTSGDNDKAKYIDNSNSNSHNNDVTIGGQSHHTSSLQQHIQDLHQLQQPTVRESLPTLLSFSLKSMDDIGESSKMSEESQGQPQIMKQHSEKTKDAGEVGMHQPAQALADLHQQQVQIVKHSNGKMLPMESLLKFANMMLYKVGPDAAPIHAQGAQLSVHGNPTTSVISIGPAVEGAEDAEAIDFLYNSVDPQLNLLHSPGSLVATPSLLSTSNSALLSRPFVLPPYSLAGPVQPISFIENALDLLLNSEDEGNDEVELVCPIHHPKKKSSENGVDDKDKDGDGVIQVCSCRFFKKNKNA